MIEALLIPEQQVLDGERQSHDTADGVWPVVAARPALMVTLAEACRRAGNSEHYTGSRNPATIKTWVYTLAKAARRERIHPVVYEGRLYVPPSLHPALSEPANPEQVSADSVKLLSEARRNKTAAKVRALNDFERYCRHGEGRALGRVKARQRFVETHTEDYRYHGNGAEHVLHLTVRSTASIKRCTHRGRANCNYPQKAANRMSRGRCSSMAQGGRRSEVWPEKKRPISGGLGPGGRAEKPMKSGVSSLLVKSGPRGDNCTKRGLGQNARKI